MQLRFFIVLATIVLYPVVKLPPADYYRELEQSRNPVFLDVRIYAEFSKSRIANAQWAGTKKVLDSLLMGVDCKTPLFIYCGDGDRTKQVASILKKKKFRKIYDLDGGFNKWVKQGFPVDEVQLPVCDQ